MKMIRSFMLSLIILISAVSLCSCSSSGREDKDTQEVINDLCEWLKTKESAPFSLVNASEDPSGSASSGSRVIDIDYRLGDIEYKRSYKVNYNYSLAFGWKLDTVEALNEETWEIFSYKAVDIDRLIRDLEGENFLSQYSNHTFEKKRLLDSQVLSYDSDPMVGYTRIKAQFVLNADNVHEILLAETEYLLDDNKNWYKLASNLSLTDVKVQKGVSDDIISDAVKSLKLYRDDDDDVWWLGDLVRVTFDVTDRRLDTENSIETIRVSFRGEGSYMYVAGNALLEFRFSSGWYLYASEYSGDYETGMLSEDWKVSERDILNSIVSGGKFTYDDERYDITEDMVSDLVITNTRIAEFGHVQTAYFNYSVNFKHAVVSVGGYGRYTLDDGVLTLDMWNDIPELICDMTGTWYAIDASRDYIAFYTMTVNDFGTGIISADIDVYGIDARGEQITEIYAKGSFDGNISAGVHYSLLDDEWTMATGFGSENLPKGSYDFARDELSDDNAAMGRITFTRDIPSGWKEQNVIRYIISSGSSYYYLASLPDELMTK
ncbi:MAG: hypothetical protein IKN24_06245 [Lachnospiraceae bacterium]|nr:hypothetical protein [Lachnospiraceae bacterium]